MRLLLQILLPVLVLAASVGIAMKVIQGREKAESRPPAPVHPRVTVETVRLVPRTIIIHSQGNVRPRTQSHLVPEVSGQVLEVSPSFVEGGFFEKDDVLLRLDRTDFELALAAARARVEQAGLSLAREEAEAAIARQEWEALGEENEGQPSPLTLREPQLASARAQLEASRADLELARRNLERTEIRAPYAGRVRSKQVDVGQFVARGSPVATIYAVDYAEVRLPLTSDEIAHIDLPLGYRDDDDELPRPRVEIETSLGGEVHVWKGEIVRTEGEIDPRTRLIYVVARVENPYARDEDADRPPLAANLFVRARIQGKTYPKTFSMPRQAARGSRQDRVLVLDDEDRVHFRDVEVLRRDAETLVIRDGLQEGDRVVTSRLDVVVENMKVRIPSAGESGAAPAGGTPDPESPESEESSP